MLLDEQFLPILDIKTTFIVIINWPFNSLNKLKERGLMSVVVALFYCVVEHLFTVTLFGRQNLGNISYESSLYSPFFFVVCVWWVGDTYLLSGTNLWENRWPFRAGYIIHTFIMRKDPILRPGASLKNED